VDHLRREAQVAAGEAKKRGRVARGKERREDVAHRETITVVAFSDTFQQHRSRNKRRKVREM